jgi:hypothetical protein
MLTNVIVDDSVEAVVATVIIIMIIYFAVCILAPNITHSYLG